MFVKGILLIAFVAIIITACPNPSPGSRTSTGGGETIPEQTVDQNYIGTWGGVEFRVENAADRAHVETALEYLKNAATEQAFIDWIDGKVNTVIVTGVDPSSISNEPMVNGVVRGRITLSDLENSLAGIISPSIS
jgi:hypothetical protein